MNQNFSVNKRYEFLYLIDVQDGNPNGDPDNDNAPRIDAETGQGLITDVCIKRKVRNYVSIKYGEEKERFKIFVRQGSILGATYNEVTKDKKEKREKVDAMTEGFYDIRTFGAVITGGGDLGQFGQVRGPIQLTFARSKDPIIPQNITITRCAVQEEKKKEGAEESSHNQTMGRKYTVPYGLYIGKGFFSPHFAKKTKFSDEDLNLFFEAMSQLFLNDQSSARGLMSMRKIIIFEHNSELGDAPAHKSFERLSLELKDSNIIPRQYSDYLIKIDGQELKNSDIIERYSA